MVNNDQQLEARTSLYTSPSEGIPRSHSLSADPRLSLPRPRIQRAQEAEPHAPLLPSFRPRIFWYLPRPGGLSSSPASSPLPAPSLHVPSSRGRSHVGYWQLGGALTFLSGL